MANTLLIHEVHDMWPSTLIELGGMKLSNPFVKVIQKAEKSAYGKSDCVVSILPNSEPYMLEHGLRKGHFEHIPNGVVPSDWTESCKIPEEVCNALSLLKRKDRFIVGYFGGHSISNALDSLLDCAKLVQMVDSLAGIVFVLVGDGSEKDKLIKRVKEENIDNVQFFNSVPKKTIPDLLNFFDCIYIGTENSSLYRFGLGLNKLFDSMMSGKPIILSTNAEKTIVQLFNCGFVVPACDPESAMGAIVKIYHLDESKRIEMGVNGKNAIASYFTYSKLARQFENVMKTKSKLNILLINHYAGSPEMGMEFRPYYLAREWVKDGNRVDIIAADFSHLRMKNPIRKKDFQEDVIDGIHYHWIHTGRYHGNGIRRALTMFEFVGKLYLHARRIAKQLNPDVIITSSTYPLDTYAGQRIKKIMGGGILVHEIHDMWPLTPVELFGMSPRHPFIRILQKAENSFCKNSDKIVSILPCADSYLVDHGMNARKFIYVANGIDLDSWRDPIPLQPDLISVIREAQDEGRFIIVFFGSHTKSYCIDILLKAAAELKSSKVFLLFVGEGNNKSYLIDLALELNLEKHSYAFMPSIPKRAIPSLLNVVDASYVGALKNQMFRFGIGMNKLFDAMMGGKPILYAVDAPNNLVKEFHCGISVPAESVDHLKNGIETLLKMDSNSRRELGLNGQRAVVSNFTYTILARQFLEGIRQ